MGCATSISILAERLCVVLRVGWRYVGVAIAQRQHVAWFNARTSASPNAS